MAPPRGLGGFYCRTALKGHDFSRAESANPTNRALAPEGDPCAADWTYPGPSGRFAIAVQYFDISNGTARFAFAVNGKNIGSWAADASLPTSLPHGDNSTRFTLPPQELHPGDTLRVAATPDGPDHAALDYIELTPATLPEPQP